MCEDCESHDRRTDGDSHPGVRQARGPFGALAQDPCEVGKHLIERVLYLADQTFQSFIEVVRVFARQGGNSAKLTTGGGRICGDIPQKIKR